MQADSEVEDAARYMDWGVVVSINQGGNEVYVVGLNGPDAAALLREAADALEPKGWPGAEDRKREREQRRQA